MKKIFALIMALMMLTIVFAACGENTDSNDPVADDTGSGNDAVDVSDVAYVVDNGKMVIGITEYEPMNYLDENHEWTGFDTEFAEAVCEKLGVEAEFIVIEWDNKFLELEAKSIDAIWNGMTITDETLANASVSDAYVKNAQVIVMDSAKIADYDSTDDMGDLTFAAEAGSAGEAAANELEFNTIAVSDQQAALLEVSSGSADACIIDITMANAMIGEGTSYESLGIHSELNTEEYGIAFRKGSDLCTKVNTIIEELMEDGTLDNLAEKYSLTLVK